jgi:hypothetical protein
MSEKQRLNFANTRKERLTFLVVKAYPIECYICTNLFTGDFSAV